MNRLLSNLWLAVGLALIGAGAYSVPLPRAQAAFWYCEGKVIADGDTCGEGWCWNWNRDCTTDSVIIGYNGSIPQWKVVCHCLPGVAAG